MAQFVNPDCQFCSNYGTWSIAQQLRRQKLWRCRSANLEQSAMWPANTWRQLQTF